MIKIVRLDLVINNDDDAKNNDKYKNAHQHTYTP